MKFNRRWLLQRTGLSLLALGASDMALEAWAQGLTRWGDRTRNAIAAPASRKLALLIGINQYPQLSPLAGCLTDIELQQDLLRYRFGFQPENILCLRNEQATRQGIVEAFENHLIANGQGSDLVFIHYSGYGYRGVRPASLDGKGNLQSPRMAFNYWVTADSKILSVTRPPQQESVTGASTIKLLVQALATERVIGVLDTSFALPTNDLMASLRYRSRPAKAQSITPDELPLQQQIRQKYSLSDVGSRAGRSPFAPLLFKAAAEEQLAVEVLWETFCAGLFTAALTEYLWETTPATTIRVILTGAHQEMLSATGVPQLPDVPEIRSSASLSDYGLNATVGTAEGVVSQVKDPDNIHLRLTGLPAMIANHYGLYSRFRLVLKADNLQGLAPQDVNPDTVSSPRFEDFELQIRERNGLSGICRFLGNEQVIWNERIAVGQLWQEYIRILPKQIKLVVALDPDLARIERVDATSALSGVALVEETVDLGGRAFDCLLSTVPPSPEAITELEAPGGYGLFALSGQPLPDTVGPANEAVKSAVKRLIPTFKTLLAAKLCRLCRNEFSANVAMRVTLEQEAEKPIILNQQLTRGLLRTHPSPQPSAIAITPVPISLAAGTKLRLRLENLAERSLYYLILAFNTSSKAYAWYSPAAIIHSSDHPSIAAANSTQLSPSGLDGEMTLPHWLATEPVGNAEVHVFCSVSPFINAFALLGKEANWKGSRGKMLEISDPLAVTRALLVDLHNGGTGVASMNDPDSFEAYLLNVDTWVTASFYYQVT